jgi:NNP family nitrate/nitrite transporter-like MFS transporter
MNEGAEATIHGSRQGALWLATLGFFGGFAGVAVFGPMVPRFVEILGLTPLQAGLMAGIPNLTGSLLRIPFGAWVDRAGGKKPFLWLLSLTLAGMAGLLLVLWTSYPNNMDGLFPVLMGLGVLIGCGIATFSVGISQVSYWHPRRQQGGPLGIYAGLGNTGPGIFSWLLPAVVASLGILTAYGLWFVGLAVIVAVYAIFIKDAPSFQLQNQGTEPSREQLESYGQDLIPTGSTWAGLRSAAGESATWALVYFYFISFGGFLALTAWLPTYWTQTHAVAATMAGLLTLMFSLLTALIRVPGGMLSDRVSIRYALTGNFLLIILGALLVALSGSFSVAVVATIMIAAGMGLQNAIVFKLVAFYVPNAVGGASGWVGGLGALSGFLLPPIMGAIAGAAGGDLAYARGFLVVAVLAVIGIVGVGWLTRWTWQYRPEQSKGA